MVLHPSLIAVVDDEESVRLALTRLLRASAYEVVAFDSGESFLSSLQQIRLPDCVILDFQMPGMSGGDVQRALFMSKLRLPIIIVTAHDQATLRDRCVANGAAAYFSKPLRGAQLLPAIGAALQHHNR